MQGVIDTWPVSVHLLKTKISLDLINLRKHLTKFSFPREVEMIGNILAKWKTAYDKIIGKATLPKS